MYILRSDDQETPARELAPSPALTSRGGSASPRIDIAAQRKSSTQDNNTLSGSEMRKAAGVKL